MSVSKPPMKTPSPDPKLVRPRQRLDIFQQALRLPIVIWQCLFFIAPLFFLVAMSFFIVRNYRMTEAFELKNWLKMMSRDYFWDSYGFTIGLATLATLVVMMVA